MILILFVGMCVWMLERCHDMSCQKTVVRVAEVAWFSTLYVVELRLPKLHFSILLCAN